MTDQGDPCSLDEPVDRDPTERNLPVPRRVTVPQW